MKKTIALFGVLVSGIALAAPKATLRIPVMLDLDGNNDRPVHSSTINAKVIKAGLKALPSYIEIADTDKDSYKKVEAVSSLASAALKKIGYADGSLASGLVPGDLDKGNFTTCFTGDGALVADLTKNVTDMIYSDQYGVHGWKFKNLVGGEDGELDSDSNDWLNENSEIWKKWNQKQDAVLVLSHVGDGGDDVSESIIKRCK
jgi:hypothetical protein